MKSFNFGIIKRLSSILFVSMALMACSGSSGGTSVVSGSANTANTPSITVSANSTSIAYNASTTVTWSSTDSTSCSSSSGTGGTGTTGSFNTGALTTTTTYTVTCVGAGGSSVSKSITITAALPSITAFAVAAGGKVTVTSANDLNNGAYISISGTADYNGTYTVADVTPTSFTIVHSFIADDASGTWQLAGGMISGCSATGATSSINMTTYKASRYTGVAPLSVFFDATGTTATATTAPFHDLEYRWNFGEDLAVLAALPGGANWTNGSTNSSRNLASGPIAAHVFETPGVYTVALTATDGKNTVSNSCAQIVVQDPNVVFSGTNTICVSASSLPVAGSGGCPAGASTAQQSSFAAAISSYAKTGKRVLFKRGDTFSAPTSAGISATGPGIIGAYGTGAKPVVQSTGNVPLLTLSSQSTPTMKDWRIMDLYFDGLSGSSAHGLEEGGGFNQITCLRLDMRNVTSGFHTSGSVSDYYRSSGHRIHDEYSIVDSTVEFTPAGYSAFVAGHYLSLMGNSFGNGTPTRFPLIVKAVISNNTLFNAAATKELIKLHAPTTCDSTVTSGCNYTNDTFPLANVYSNDGVKTFGYSEDIIISDNKLQSGNVSDYMLTLGTQNGNSDERVRNLILERNWLIAGTGTQMVVGVMSRNVTVRNNICDVSLATKGSRCFNVGKWGIEPPPDHVQIYSNTVYSSASGSVQGVLLFPESTYVTVKNNLGYTPAASGSIMVDGTAGSGFAASNNSTNSQMQSTDSKFAGPLTMPAGFKPTCTGATYPCGQGTTVPVWSDFFSVPQTATPDLGAAIH